MESNRILIKEVSAEQLAVLDQYCFDKAWTPEDYLRWQHYPAFQGWILASLSHEHLAFLAFFQHAQEIEVFRLAVLAAYRHQGLAICLLEQLIRHARHHKVLQIFLEVHSENQAAIQVYRKVGFTEMGRRKAYYSKPDGDALLFQRAIFQNED